jgi:predicted  nucleic acid-binding Zn-ribbon protein
MDEQTPHLHIDYIPVGKGYKQGLQSRNSLAKAFECMGIQSGRTKDDNGTIKWQERERKKIAEIAKSHGIEIKTIGIKRDDYTLSDYKTLVHDKKQILQQREQVKPDRVNLPFGMALEKNRDAVTQELDRKQHVGEFVAAMSGAADQHKAAMDQISAKQLQLFDKEIQLDSQMNKALSAEHQYQNLYAKQTNLNKDFVNLKESYKYIEHQNCQLNEVADKLMKENSDLKAEVGSLKAQIDHLRSSIENRVHDAVEPLKKQIRGLISEHIDLVQTFSFFARTLSDPEHREIASKARDYGSDCLRPDLADKAKNPVVPSAVRSFDSSDFGRIERKLEKKQAEIKVQKPRHRDLER